MTTGGVDTVDPVAALAGTPWDVRPLELGRGLGGRPRAERSGGDGAGGTDAETGAGSTEGVARRLVAGPDAATLVAMGREHVLHVEVHELEFDIICSPLDVEALLVGHLLAEGFVDDLSGLAEWGLEQTESGSIAGVTLRVWEPGRQKRHLNVTWTECGSAGELLRRARDRLEPLPRTWGVDAAWLRAAMQAFAASMHPWGVVGGIHQVVLLDHAAPEVLVHAIDVGRHNAFDRAVGRAALDGLDLSRLVCLTTGRVSSDIVLKAQRAGVAVIGTLNAALDSAVRLARHVDLGVVCYLKRRPALVISGAERFGLAALAPAEGFAADEPPMG